jgi:hypothetical protein
MFDLGMPFRYPSIVSYLDSYFCRQRDQVPVPNGYEEVLQPDFFAEVDQLCFAIMEVKKPNMPREDIEDDARKLPCMMKIALNMLIQANVQDATVVGFLVNGMLCNHLPPL